MAEEEFDVVDAADRVVGRATRREVHARGLWHRAVHVLVFNRAGDVFLHQRTLTKDTSPGRWDSSCAGHLGAGEDYDGTAVRELEEEIGLSVSDPSRLRRILRVEACAETGWEFVWVYRLEDEGPFRLNPDEIARGDWFRPAAVDDWVRSRPEEFALSFVLLWTRWRAEGGK